MMLWWVGEEAVLPHSILRPIVYKLFNVIFQGIIYFNVASLFIFILFFFFSLYGPNRFSLFFLALNYKAPGKKNQPADIRKILL